MQIRSVITTTLCSLIALTALTGCGGTGYGTATSGQTVYSAQFAQSPLEYTNFLNKEIETVTNQLSTQIMLAESVCNNNYPTSDAIVSVGESIQIVEECINNVDTMQPPESYAENRTSTLSLMQNAKSSLEAYKQALMDGSTSSIESCKSVMQSDYIAVTAQFGAYWE